MRHQSSGFWPKLNVSSEAVNLVEHLKKCLPPDHGTNVKVKVKKQREFILNVNTSQCASPIADNQMLIFVLVEFCGTLK